MTASRAEPVVARPAATLVLLRPPADGGDGFEVLLTKRPDSMRFGPGMVVFPGGRLEADESAAEAALRETREETGIEVDPAALVPMTRWVTPYALPARFDARFYGAVVPSGTDIVSASPEVSTWSWLRPTAALEAMAAGRLAMWQPTVVTLQQLEGVMDAGSLARAVAPTDRDQPAAGDSDASAAGGFSAGGFVVPTRWSAGIEGRRGGTRVVGRTRWVVVDPPDPTDETLQAVLARADLAGATLAGVVVTDLEPASHAGVEMFARGLGLPVAGPPGADARAPYSIQELAQGATVPFGDERLRVAEVRPPDGGGRWAGRVSRLRLEGD